MVRFVHTDQPERCKHKHACTHSHMCTCTHMSTCTHSQGAQGAHAHPRTLLPTHSRVYSTTVTPSLTQSTTRAREQNYQLPSPDYVPSDDDDDDDDGALLGAANTGRLNFGGFERTTAAGDEDGDADPDRPRTRKEIMEEVMMKSKKHKMERQQAALETSNKVKKQTTSNIVPRFCC
jgi:hypothetical protein